MSSDANRGLMPLLLPAPVKFVRGASTLASFMAPLWTPKTASSAKWLPLKQSLCAPSMGKG